MRLTLLAWTVETRLGVTEAVYRRLAGGAAEQCACSACKNFHAMRPQHFNEEFLGLLSSLRIDPCKEQSVRLVSPLEGQRCLYAGTYGFFGEILAGRPPRGFPAVRQGVDVFERVGGDAHVALRPWPHPPAPWEDSPCVRLEFLVVLPWRPAEAQGPKPERG